MLPSEFARVWCETVTARVTAQPKAIAEAFHVGQMNLTPTIVLGFGMPHVRHPGSRTPMSAFGGKADIPDTSRNVRF